MITLKDAAVRLGVSVTTMRRFVAAGEIGFYRIGKSQMFDESDIQAYLARVHVAPKPKVRLAPAPDTQPVKRGPGRPPNSSKIVIRPRNEGGLMMTGRKAKKSRSVGKHCSPSRASRKIREMKTSVIIRHPSAFCKRKG